MHRIFRGIYLESTQFLAPAHMPRTRLLILLHRSTNTCTFIRANRGTPYQVLGNITPASKGERADADGHDFPP